MIGNLFHVVFSAVLAASAGVSQAPLPDAVDLAAGDYRWHPEASPRGPLVVIVSLDEQRAYVYRNGVAIGVSTISSGRKDHATPSGVFTILQKDRDHHSNVYNNASMPFMERLTWDGIALHGGTLPGYPASHGCVRLPQEFAEKLFSITERGETVVVADGQASAIGIVHPSVLAPVTAAGREQVALPDAAVEWNDGASTEGPVSILVSVPDRRVYVLRNGIRIGSSTLAVAENFTLGGSVVFVMLDKLDDVPSPLVPALKRHTWSMYPVAGSTATVSMDELASKFKVPDEFAARVYSVLSPGTSVLVTDLPAVRSATQGYFEQAVLQSTDVVGVKVTHERR